MTTLDVVVLNHNTRADLEACLASLAAHPSQYPGTLIVVDNASRDGSQEAVTTGWPGVRLIALDQNRGFGAANNVAMRQSTADLVLLLNSDTIVPPGALDLLVERLLATGAAAAGPRLVDGQGHPEISFGRMLSPWTEAVQRLRVRAASRRGRLARAYVRRLTARERPVDWVSGACFLVRREAALEAGLFDERYFMYEEDVDLCAALRARGGRILYTPLAQVTHLRGRSVAASGASTAALYDRSHLAFYEKHAPRWAPVLRGWLALRGRGPRAAA